MSLQKGELLMSHRRTLRAELDTLRVNPGGAKSDQPASTNGDSSDRASDLHEIVQELRVKLAEAAHNAEDLAAAHPLATVTAALLLGIVLGRKMGSTR
jgi:hypothetical protein